VKRLLLATMIILLYALPLFSDFYARRLVEANLAAPGLGEPGAPAGYLFRGDDGTNSRPCRAGLPG